MPKVVEQVLSPKAPATKILTAKPLAPEPSPAKPPIAQAAPAISVASQSDIPLIDTGKSHATATVSDHSPGGEPKAHAKKPIGMLVGLLVATGVAIPAGVVVVGLLLWKSSRDVPAEDPTGQVVQTSGDESLDPPLNPDEARILMEWPEQERTKGQLYINDRSYRVSSSGPLEVPLKPGDYRIRMTRTVAEQEERYEVQVALEGGKTFVVRPDWEAAVSDREPPETSVAGISDDGLDPIRFSIPNDPPPGGLEPTPSDPTPGALEQLLASLRGAGIEASSVKQGNVPIVSKPGLVVEADGQRFHLFECKSSDEARAEKDRIAAAAGTEQSQAWPKPVHLYQHEQWIVVYAGSEQALLDKLADRVGAPFASVARPVSALEQFLALLRQGGVEASYVQQGDVPVVSKRGAIVEADGQRFHCFECKSSDEAREVRDRIAAAADTEQSQAWPKPVHVYLHDRWIVVYSGSEQTLLDRLASRVGAPFASLPGGEPPTPGENQHPLLGQEATLVLWDGKSIEKAKIVEVDAVDDPPDAFRALLISQGENERKRRIQAKALGRIVVGDRPYRVDLKKDSPGLYVLFDIQAHREEVDRFLRTSGRRLWSEPTSEEQAAAVAEHKTFLDKVAKAFPGMWLHETEYFLFYTDIPPQQVGPIALQLDAMYSRLCQIFGVVVGQNIWRGKAVVVAFMKKESFIQFEASFMNNPNAAQAAGLHHGSSNGNVIISCYNLGDASTFGQVLVHETAHGFLHRYYSTVHVVSWVNEGIADWVAHMVVPQCRQVPLKQESAKQQLRQTRSLGGTFFRESGNIDGWQYGAASQITDMMIAVNPRGYGNFVNAIKEGKTVEESLLECYGCTPEQLVQAYGRQIGVPDLRP